MSQEKVIALYKELKETLLEKEDAENINAEIEEMVAIAVLEIKKSIAKAMDVNYVAIQETLCNADTKIAALKEAIEKIALDSDESSFKDDMGNAVVYKKTTPSPVWKSDEEVLHYLYSTEDEKLISLIKTVQTFNKNELKKALGENHDGAYLMGEKVSVIIK